MSSANNCLICNNDLLTSGNSQEATCIYCGSHEKANYVCAEGHYICPACYSADAVDIILRTCKASESTDPLELVELLIRHPSINIHGSEYHFMVPAVLLTAYYNAVNQKDELDRQLNEALKRSNSIPAGYCGYHGVCGAAIGTGIFMSLILHSTPMSVKGWKLRNEITAGSLKVIAEEGDPRCCKRNSYLAIEYAVELLQAQFHIPVGKPNKISCVTVGPNPECLKSGCRFYHSYRKEKSRSFS